MVSRIRPLFLGLWGGGVVTVGMIASDQQIALVSTPQDVLWVTPLRRIVNTVPSDELGWSPELFKVFPDRIFTVFCRIASGMVINLWPAHEEFRVNGKCSRVKVWPYKEARKESVHATSEFSPRIHNWDKPVWFVEINRFSKLDQNIALEFAGDILRPA